jgi:large subunit ribosomal protein L4
MASLDVISVGGAKSKKAGSLELDPTVFEAEVRSDLLHAEVRRQLAARRTGTHSSRNRAAVAGGGAKPYRQKGTGRARQGTIRAPQWAGGGAVFGPVPRGHGHKLPKKVRAAALRAALSLRHSEGAITVVDSLELDAYKTSAIVGILETLGIGGRSVLIMLAEPSAYVEVSARNLPGVNVVRAEGLNVYDVLRHEVLLATQTALESIVVRLAKPDKENAE